MHDPQVRWDIEKHRDKLRFDCAAVARRGHMEAEVSGVPIEKKVWCDEETNTRAPAHSVMQLWIYKDKHANADIGSLLCT